MRNVLNLLLAFTLLHCVDIFVYLRFLDKRVQDVQHTVRRPWLSKGLFSIPPFNFDFGILPGQYPLDW